MIIMRQLTPPPTHPPCHSPSSPLTHSGFFSLLTLPLSAVDCVDPQCSGHGVCVRGECVCSAGWAGVSCNDPLPACQEQCSGHGTYLPESDTCACQPNWTGPDCYTELCPVPCGSHGVCSEGKCQCEEGWIGAACDQRACHPRCEEHGQCHDGTCICQPGWEGEHCNIVTHDLDVVVKDGCPGLCSGHGRCTLQQSGWRCICQAGWSGPGCSVVMETDCSDGTDNDGGDILHHLSYYISFFPALTCSIPVSSADCPLRSNHSHLYSSC
ncbi:hypothetical protein ILYODFUR_010405 [Ilyodon furcidens]|uniref:EGF-like domain-containing protein n=1 Tax=Ilyodon furcidens TaxID=33524 RepID=A0ABV0V1Y1_9TELE